MKSINHNTTTSIVNFSLRKEVFFIVIGSIIGATIMVIPPSTLSALQGNSDTFWLAAASVVGSTIQTVGIIIHLLVAIAIGTVVGLILYLTKLLDISRLRNGIIFGLLAGIIVEVIFTIPVYQFLLIPNIISMNLTADVMSAQITVEQILTTLIIHLIWGAVLGYTASILTTKFGANYRCQECDIEFSRLDVYLIHMQNIHDSNSFTTNIVILGGGYAGVGVLNHLQNKFDHNPQIHISMISETNFFLHTPMLPEMATGIIEPRHIATPLRNFCKRARFYQASVSDISLNDRMITTKTNDGKINTINFDYLVVAMGSETKFWSQNVKKHALTIKTLSDALFIRNHIISNLEKADQESDKEVQKHLTTFVVVGGGFSGVEMVGELNHFVREVVKKYYRNIDYNLIKVVLISANDGILPEIGNLGIYAKKTLEKAGVKIYTKTKLTDADENSATLSDGTIISCKTLIWAGGNAMNSTISNLDTEHHKNGRLIVDDYLRLPKNKNVFALGDCAMIIDSRNNTPYPPTAQHAIREAKTVSDNIIGMIEKSDSLSKFIYDTKGTMAKLGGRDGVAILLGHEFRGLIAWFLWKHYYLSTLPTMEKKIRVGLDWSIGQFFPQDVTHLSGIN